MTIKKICAIVFLLLFLVVAVWLAFHYFNTSKQIYEGVLVYNKDCGVEESCYQV